MWLPPLAWATQVEALVGLDIVCPFCVVWRATDANLPGFNNQKRNRILAVLASFNCMKAEGSRSTGHTHLYDFQNENLTNSRKESPQLSERGY